MYSEDEKVVKTLIACKKMNKLAEVVLTLLLNVNKELIKQDPNIGKLRKIMNGYVDAIEKRGLDV